MTGINDRIDKLIRALGYNKTKFAHALGYNYNTIIESIVGKRQSKPGFDFLNALLTTFPSVNADWLMIGEGEMLKEKSKATERYLLHKQEVTKVPLIGQYAYAGYLRGFGDVGFMDSQPLYYSNRHYGSGTYVAFEIRGDSMHDGTDLSIIDGDIVMCKALPHENWINKLHVPKVFVIIHKTEGITCKEVIAHNVESGEITCHSWNSDPEYFDFTVKLHDVIQLFYLKEISRKVKN